MTNRKSFRVWLPMAGLIVVLAACGARRTTADSTTPEALFDRGLAALQNRKWLSAQELFERFTLQFPSHPRAQEARFRLSEAYFGKKEYVTAANEFSRLANDFPAGPYADDARFKVCESYYKLSPKPELDQQYTKAALDHCQSLITYYSSSNLAPKAQELLVDLRNRLAAKELLTGEYYFKLKAYDSAIIYYEIALRDYPDTNAAPRALLRLFDTYTLLKYKEEAEASKARLLKDYPASAEAKSLQQPAPAAQ